MSTAPELDEPTRAALAAEVERLVAMGTERRQARQIVWLDYLDEQSAQAAPAPAAAEIEAPASSAPPPGPEPPPPPTPPRRYWRAEDEAPLTPEWLARNRAEVQKILKLLRSTT